MARDEIIAPVNHGIISGAATTTVEAGRSGLSGLVQGAGWGIGISSLLGATALGGFAAAVVAAPILGFGLPAIIGVGLIAGIGGALLGPVVGMPVIGGLAALGTAFGLVGGASRGVERVSQERGASEMLTAQVAALQAASLSAPGQAVGYPAQGSEMNPATSKICGAQYQDRLASPELAAARG